MAIPRKLKDKLLVEAKHECVICGDSRVQIHHIDGNNKNSDESNLIVLCMPHHDEAQRSLLGPALSANLTPDQLRLYKEKEKQESIYSKKVEKGVGLEFFLPVPPMPYFAHPYPMQKNFTGRMAERMQLTEWFTNSPEPMFAYVAMGGMGKSALSWYWLQEDIIKQGLAPEGIIWWSFYDKEARFETFLEKAIQYASKGKADLEKIASNRDRMECLYNILGNKRFLLVLDGVERVLRAYAGLGSPYQGDEVKEDEKQDFRRCVDPNVGTFLQWLASAESKTKTLLTSRLFPKELEDIAGYLSKDLKDMKKTDAIDFFHRQGVKGARAEIETACDPFGYHPLCLRLLSGMILKDPKFKGDVNAWTRQDPLSDLKAKEHPILELAYSSLEQRKQKLISKLSAFRNPMEYDSILIFNEFDSQKEFDHALIELQDRGLLLWVDKTETYDLHPIVRKYCYDRLLDKKGVHSQLRDYFSKVPQPEKIESLDDLVPVIELYHHTVNCGRYDEAFQLVRDRLHGRIYYRFGAYRIQTELFGALFPAGEDNLPYLKEEHDQGWALVALGNSYSLSGQPKKAVPLFEMALKMDEKVDDKLNVAIGLVNLADDQMKIGNLKSAETNLRRMINLCQQIEEDREAVGHQELGRLLAYQGRFEESEKELANAMMQYVAMEKIDHAIAKEWQGKIRAYYAIRFLLSENVDKTLKAAERARELADVKHPERDIIRAEWLLGAAYLMKGELKVAEKHLDEALKRDRKINLVEVEPDILLGLAKLRFKQERKEEALKLANEALQIADRCEYRLNQADINNFLAEFYLDIKDYKTAKKHADIARERAECGYKPALDKAKKLGILVKEKSKQ